LIKNFVLFIFIDFTCATAMERTDVRKIINYCFLRRLSPMDALKEICATYGSDFVSLSTVKRWYRKFKSGEENFEDAQRSGRPSKSLDDKIEEQLAINKRATTREIAQEIGESHETVWRHLLKMGKRFLENVWVAHKLSESNKQSRVEICSRLLEMLSKNNFLNQMITVDEIWIYWENTGTFNNKSWRGAADDPLTSPCRTLTTNKHMATIFWDAKGLLLMDVLPRNQTINAAYYCEQLQKLTAAIQNKRRRLISTGYHNVHFHQDNATPHTAIITRAKLTSLGFTLVPHPPYSPDLAPSDFYLFSPLKRHLSGKCFENEAEISAELEEWFARKPTDFFREGIHKLPDRWRRCIVNGGNYFQHMASHD
jgi:histone-lysine N-methyltransferase SETMAR